MNCGVETREQDKAELDVEFAQRTARACGRQRHFTRYVICVNIYALCVGQWKEKFKTRSLKTEGCGTRRVAEMNAPKISAMENEPRNLTIGTLIRVAHALGSRVKIKLVRRKGAKLGRRNGAGRVKTGSV